MSDRPASLSARLVGGALVWLLLLLLLGGGVLALAFRDTVEQEFGHRLDAMLRAMIAATEIAPDGTVAVVRPLGDPRFEQIFSGWYWQVSEPGGRRLRSRSLWDATLPTGTGGNAMQTRRLDGPRGEPLLVVERDLAFPDAAGPVHVLIAGDLREVADGVRRFHLLLAAALGLLGCGMAAAVAIQVRFGLQPLRALAADLDGVRAGDHPRLDNRYPCEVAPLAEAMNGVLDADTALIERARTHVGNLAHGLKTPLAVIGTEMAGTPDRAVVTAQLHSMRRLIEHHLTRAAAVAGAGRTLGVKVPVDEVAQAIAAVLTRVFADKRLAIAVEAEAGAAFRGAREDLEEMLGNLMENAAKWAAARVLVRAVDDSGVLQVTVEDEGPGLSADQSAAAARRGRRFDEMAPGWGLGLAIVADLAAVNGGTMAFDRSALGGLRVRLSLPTGAGERLARPGSPL
ncbi:MAG: HAMP domain-containing histidine kinase [Magnetospirillum sp.]|nr:HAMP domain-containing histidine kinase [Magnetospirillum sp.]